MVNTLLVELIGIYDMHNSICQITSICRCANLIEHHLELIFGGSQRTHGLDEVLAKGGIEPGRAYDDVLTPYPLDALLASQLRDPIDSQRIGLPCFLTRRTFVSFENIVGRDVDQGCISLFGSCGKHFHSGIIQQIGCIIVIFCLIYIGIGRTVNNDVDVLPLDHFLHCLQIGDIQTLHIPYYICKHIMVSALRAHQSHFIAKLSVGTGYKYVRH